MTPGSRRDAASDALHDVVDRDADCRAVERAAAGDHAGLAELYDRHATAVYSLALRIVRRPEDAEDVAQQVFSQVWHTAATYDRSRGVVAAWLLMMARSRAIDCLRRRDSTRGDGAGDAQLAAIPDPGPSVEHVVATREQLQHARVALDGLPEPQRETLELAYYAGLTHSEISERTATPLGTVKTRLRSALQALRAAMATGGGNPPETQP